MQCLRRNLSDDGVVDIRMQSDQRDQTDDQSVEGLMFIGDGHAVFLLEFTYRGTAQVVGDTVGRTVDELEV